MELVNSSTNLLYKIVTQYVKEFFTRHYLGDQNKEMDRVCGMNNGEMCIHNFGGKTK
jgi:hypothetical protein